MKEDLRVKRTKKLLLSSLLRLAVEDGHKLNDISVQEICDHAMVHRTTFYRYYTDKYDLLLNGSITFKNLTTDMRKKNILTPFTFFLEHPPFPNHEKFVRNNLNDIYFQNAIQKMVVEQLTKDLSEFISIKSLPVPLNIAVQVYSTTVGQLFGTWLINNNQPSADVMDKYLQATLNPFYFELLE
jgi:hypothetical protein